ncbi:hypothetical protein EBS02_09950, partial [bacterium]|nr:hypothetical protein [bacterium]
HTYSLRSKPKSLSEVYPTGRTAIKQAVDKKKLTRGGKHSTSTRKSSHSVQQVQDLTHFLHNKSKAEIELYEAVQDIKRELKKRKEADEEEDDGNPRAPSTLGAPSKPSEEQQYIIDCVKDGYSVMIDAVAGSGKTTTIINLAHQIPGKKILQVTYNAALKFEVREKVIKYGLKNLEIHSYHSLAVNYFDPTAYNDIHMKKALNKQDKHVVFPSLIFL